MGSWTGGEGRDKEDVGKDRSSIAKTLKIMAYTNAAEQVTKE